MQWRGGWQERWSEVEGEVGVIPRSYGCFGLVWTKMSVKMLDEAFKLVLLV